MKLTANAHPEKRLFISLLTRDISLVDAFLDMLDNSINAALKSESFGGKSAEEYWALLNSDTKFKYEISVNFTEKQVAIQDNCGGISADQASSSVFVFGAPDEESHDDDRLSVYGIGLKRAMFKLGNNIKMAADHKDGGFDLNLNVKEWEKKAEERWTFDINKRAPSAKGQTTITVNDLHDDVKSRLIDPSFETDLVNRISKAYFFFIGKIVSIRVNGVQVEGADIGISDNKASISFEKNDVSVNIVAGIGTTPDNGRYSAEKAGWTVFCNGRAVTYFDKTVLTGWGVEGYLPIFQPKHRPFVGIAFFTSDTPEKLPWTTTKLGVNPDNIVWQTALQKMADVGRQVTRFLDGRYSEEGTTITMADLQDAIGSSKTINLNITNQASTFKAPTKKEPPTTSVQYRVDKKQINAVKKYIGSPSMSNSDVGLYTFNYFISNEVSND